MHNAPIYSQNVMCLVIIKISFNISFLTSKVYNNSAWAFQETHIVV